jgi:hypothetical protein
VLKNSFIGYPAAASRRTPQYQMTIATAPVLDDRATFVIRGPLVIGISARGDVAPGKRPSTEAGACDPQSAFPSPLRSLPGKPVGDRQIDD